MSRRPIIAIDGPAGSGKSSTARAVARALHYAHVDSGAVYRAITLIALDNLGPPDGWQPDVVVATAKARPVRVNATAGEFEVWIGGLSVEPAIRKDRVTAEVSRVAAMPEVRSYVNQLLREAARFGGVVMDGRDIGTVVFPDAEVKVFLDAHPEERARRRLKEKGETTGEHDVHRESRALQLRDQRDSTRSVAPLARAPDAVLIDTSQLDFEHQVARVVELVEAVTRQPLKAQ
jgi:cytidylate kinase